MRSTLIPSFLFLLASCGVDAPGQTSSSSSSGDDDAGTSEESAQDEDEIEDEGAATDEDQDEDETEDEEPSDDDAPPGPIMRDGGNDLCEKRTINAQAVPPDVLIVLDKSASMALGLRWDPSRLAVEMLVSQFDGQVAFGLSTFPAGDLGQCDPGELDVPVGLDNGAAITEHISSIVPLGITPTAQTLENALTFLGDRNPSGDTVGVPPTYVLLVTDGEPNCPDLEHLDPEQSSIDAVQALREANIKTFVIGYDLSGGGASLMDQLAQTGGTDHYYAVESQTDLNEAFAEITKGLISCTFELSEVPPDPSYVRVVIDGQSVVLDSADGWVIDGKVVTLQGGACDTLRDGEPHQLESQVECEPVVVM